ncbi:MAG: salt stress protein, Slr1339 family [Microcoleus sp.]
MESIDLWFAELKDDHLELAKVEPDLLETPALSSPTIPNSETILNAGVVDRDLAQIKAEYEELEETIAAAKEEADLPTTSIAPILQVQAAENKLYSIIVDSDLAQIKAEYEQRDRGVSPVKLEPEFQTKSVFSTPTIATSEKRLDAGVIDSDLAQIKIEYEECDRESEVAKQEQQPTGQIAQQELQVKTRREKVRQAQVWLKKLDKNSDEGFWFDRFAYKYDCRVEAAIDYLAAVKES